MMKRVVLIAGLAGGFFLSMTARAADYYLSTSGDDANAGTSASAPWKTIDKLNDSFASLQPGDRVLFKRGEIFYGGIRLTKGGDEGTPLTIGAYGSGAKPIITGFRTVDAWEDLGNHIWQSADPVSTLDTLKIVLVDGVNTPIGRTPTSLTSHPFLHYLTIDSHQGSESITSSDLAGASNWVGAEIVVRINAWTLRKGTITQHDGNTLTYVDQPEEPTDGWGFFLQNHPDTLDAPGEWYYDPSTRKIRIYSLTKPNKVEVTTVDRLVESSAGYKRHVIIDDLEFRGANLNAIKCSECPNFTVINSTISYSGEIGLTYGYASDHARIENNDVSDCGSSSITGYSKDAIIRNNRILRTGLVSVILPHDYGSAAIGCSFDSSRSLVQYNIIDETAYNGIFLRGENVEIRNNFIRHSSMVRDDSGGIYTGFVEEHGKIIDGNIVLDCVGNTSGKPKDKIAWAHGIYIDDLGNNLTVSNNTVANCESAGLMLHNIQYITATNNTLYNNGGKGWGRVNLLVQTGSLPSEIDYTKGNRVTGNILFSREIEQDALLYYASHPSNVLANFGTFDENCYARPIGNPELLRVGELGTYTYYDLPAWQKATGQDAHSKAAPKSIDSVHELRFEYNASQEPKFVDLDSTYIDVTEKPYCGTISIAPYRSVVLMKSDVPCTPEPIDAGVDSASGGDTGSTPPPDEGGPGSDATTTGEGGADKDAATEPGGHHGDNNEDGGCSCRAVSGVAHPDALIGLALVAFASAVRGRRQSLSIRSRKPSSSQS